MGRGTFGLGVLLDVFSDLGLPAQCFLFAHNVSDDCNACFLEAFGKILLGFWVADVFEVQLWDNGWSCALDLFYLSAELGQERVPCVMHCVFIAVYQALFLLCKTLGKRLLNFSAERGED